MDSLNCGDDMVLILDHDEIDNLGYDEKYLLETMTELAAEQGLTISPEVAIGFGRGNIEDIEFCRCRPIEYERGKYVFIPHIRRALARMGVSHKHYNTGDALKWLHTLTVGDQYVFCGMPVVQTLVHRIAELAGGKHYKLETHTRWTARQLMKNRRPNYKPVEAFTRVSVDVAFGMSLQEQELLENRYANLTEKQIRQSMAGNEAPMLFGDDEMQTMS
jgi:hypothetical protein